jgi:hypothetical protein
MTTIERLMLRQELDDLEEALANSKRAREPDFVRIQRLAAEIARLKRHRFSTNPKPLRHRV